MSDDNEPVNTPDEQEVAPEKPVFSQIPPLGTPHNPPADPEFTKPVEEEVDE